MIRIISTDALFRSNNFLFVCRHFTVLSWWLFHQYQAIFYFYACHPCSVFSRPDPLPFGALRSYPQVPKLLFFLIKLMGTVAEHSEIDSPFRLVYWHWGFYSWCCWRRSYCWLLVWYCNLSWIHFPSWLVQSYCIVDYRVWRRFYFFC